MTAPDWAGVRALVDAYLDGKGGIGATAGFRTTRAKLPERANILILMSAQGFVRQMAAQLSAMIPGGPKPVPEMPAEPALIGFSLAPSTPDGFEFRMFVPQAAGPVFEKGLVPIFSDRRLIREPATGGSFVEWQRRDRWPVTGHPRWAVMIVFSGHQPPPSPGHFTGHE